MKTVIFNGSPRKNGDTKAIIDALIDRIPGEVTVLNAYDDLIKGCVDCRFCWKKPTCAFPDFKRLDDLIQPADNLILASPIYFGELTGDLLRMLSKVQVYWSAKFLRKEDIIPQKKRGALLLAYAGNCNEAYPERTAKILLNNMGVSHYLGCVASPDTDRIPAKEDQALGPKLDDLAKKLSEPLVDLAVIPSPGV